MNVVAIIMHLSSALFKIFSYVQGKSPVYLEMQLMMDVASSEIQLGHLNKFYSLQFAIYANCKSGEGVLFSSC